MKTFTIQKLYNNTIPIREHIVNIGIGNGGLKIVLGDKDWILSADHLKTPIRHILVGGPNGQKEKLMYFYLSSHAETKTKENIQPTLI